MTIGPEVLNAVGVIAAVMVSYWLKEDVVPWAKSKFNKNKKNHFTHNIEIFDLINKELSILVGKTGCNRASLIQFHNGIKSLSGLPFDFASMTNEEVDNQQKTTRQLAQFQKVPASSMARMLLDLDHSTDATQRIGPDYADRPTVEFNEYYGIVTMYNFRIGEHVQDGMVSLTWSGENIVLSDEELADAKRSIGIIRETMKKFKSGV